MDFHFGSFGLLWIFWILSKDVWIKRLAVCGFVVSLSFFRNGKRKEKERTRTRFGPFPYQILKEIIKDILKEIFKEMHHVGALFGPRQSNRFGPFPYQILKEIVKEILKEMHHMGILLGPRQSNQIRTISLSNP